MTQSLRAAAGVALASAAALLAACRAGGPAGPADAAGQQPPAAPDSVVVSIDAAHENFHTASGRYAPFAAVVRADGYAVRSSSVAFTASSLAGTHVLVVANALHPGDRDEWVLPTTAAFTTAEVEAVVAWVLSGGGLLLIADHMPFAGAAAGLAARFGVEMLNGFAFDTTLLSRPRPCLRPAEIQVFRRSDGSLGAHDITNGRTAAERVDSVATFTGQAFRAGGASPLLSFGPYAISLQPHEAWVFTDTTARVGVAGWRQGVAFERGQGRVAVFGEAAMFTEQVCDGSLPMGMNAPAAAQNARLLRNVVRWLAHGRQPRG